MAQKFLLQRGSMGFRSWLVHNPLLLMIAFWIAVMIGIVYFVKWIASTGKGPEIKQEETALDILKKRYIRGEISKEKFERIKQDIQ